MKMESETMKNILADQDAWALLDTFPVAIDLFDLEGKILFLNQAAIERYNLDKDVLAGLAIWDLLASTSSTHLKTIMRQVITQNSMIEFTEPLDNRWWSVKVFPIPSVSGRIERIATFSCEITKRIQAEEKLKLVSLQLLTNQEEERRRIAQDLHDDLGQSMTALILNLKTIQANFAVTDDETNASQLKGAISIVEDMMRHVRQVLYDLGSPSFETQSPTKVLEDLSSSLALSSNLRAVFNSQGQLPKMTNPQATAFYRLIQEGMNNTAKHAKATTVWINLEYIDGEMIISFEDDGQGFMNNQRKNYSLGLEGLKDRFLRLDGTFEVDSAPGKGTRLTGSIPISSK